MFLTRVHTCPSWLSTPAHMYSNTHLPTHTPPHTYLRSDLLRGNLGALRLKVRLVEDRVLPSEYYQPLMKLLAESVLSPAEAEVGVSHEHFCWEGGGMGIWALASPSFGAPAWAPLLWSPGTPGDLCCLLSLPRRTLRAPWPCWRS